MQAIDCCGNLMARDGVERALAHPEGGFAEDTLGTLPRRQNPHMHLLEAALLEVQAQGVTVQQKSTAILQFVTLSSPDDRYDSLFLANYATISLQPELARLPGVGQVILFGGGDYAMRVWLDPQKAAARGLTAGKSGNVSARLGDRPRPQPSAELMAEAARQGLIEGDPEDILAKYMRYCRLENLDLLNDGM